MNIENEYIQIRGKLENPNPKLEMGQEIACIVTVDGYKDVDNQDGSVERTWHAKLWEIQE